VAGSEFEGARGTGRSWKLLLGPALAGAVVLLGPGEDPKVAWMAAVAIWMAAWWVTEAVPIPVTALLPLVLLPLLGIAPVETVALDYGRPTIFLFLGGFLIALALETTGLHRRLALLLVHKVGSRPRGLVLGFLLSTGLLSMWISNTAAVMVHLPIALSVLAAVRAKGGDDPRLAAAVLIAVAYGANIGGLATPVGTPPNLIYRDQLAKLFPRAPSSSFAQWMTIGVPLATAYLGVGWLLLTRVAFRLGGEALLGSRDAVLAMRKEVGPVRRDELTAAAVFVATALFWVLRAPLGIGNDQTDGVIAIAAGILLFVLPSHERRGERLLEWRETARLPWGMLLVFGGGFALATGFQTSGLSLWLGGRLAALHGIPPFALMLIVCVAITFLTEFASNTAATQMVLPVLAAAATAAGTDPRYLMIPATLAASCGFMMPVGSPTQTIVFGTGLVPMRDMVRAGFWFDLLGIALVAALFGLLAGPLMGIEAGVLPAWAKP
jgi:solute carrier family 13 (sodium-dependent dicarboxylate transporter), member 2/3/5